MAMDDTAPVGRLDGISLRAQPAAACEALAAACVMTTGRSSSTVVHAVGAMICLAGTPMASALGGGADKTDQSLGVKYASGYGRRPARV